MGIEFQLKKYDILFIEKVAQLRLKKINMKKGDCILTYFGSFDPPTNGHLFAMTESYNYMTSLGFNVLKVFMIPAHNGFNKIKKGLIEASHRVKMCQLMTKNIDFIECDSVEANKDHWSRTVETLEYFKEKYPNKKIFFICGIDIIDALGNKWPETDVIKIINEFGLIILPRKNEDLTNIEFHCKYLIGKMQNVYKISSNPLNNVSSTLIRTKLSKHERISGLTSYDVEKYIYENHLYST